MSEKKILTKEILEYRLIPIEDFGSMTPEAAELYAEKGEFTIHDGGSKNLAWINELSSEVAEKLPTNRYGYDGLELNQLTELSVDSARALARNEGENLSLNGLSSLSPEVAEALAGYGGNLSLHGICSLDEKTAEALSSFSGESINLPSLTEVSEEALIKLATSESHLSLYGLQTLSEKVAEALVSKNRILNLRGLVEISDATASILSRNPQNYLNEKIDKQIKAAEKKALESTAVIPKADLSKIRKLIKTDEGEKLALACQLLESFEASEADYVRLFPKTVIYRLLNTWDPKAWDALWDTLIQHRKTEVLLIEQVTKRLKSVPSEWSLRNKRFEDANAMFSNCKESTLIHCVKCTDPLYTDTDCGMRLNAIKELSDEAAESLSKHKGTSLFINGLKKLSDAAAESLSKFKGKYLDLNGLTELSAAAAKSLSKHEGTLELNGLTELSDTATESLSKYEGTLKLNGLTELSDTAAKSLSKHEGWIELNGLTELSDTAAESLSKFKGRCLSLNGLVKLGDTAAQYLATLEPGSIGLEGLTELGDVPGHLALAANFSKLNCNWLSLGSLVSMSDEVAEVLSKSKGELRLSGLTELSDAAAESLSKHQHGLSLKSLTEMSDAAAEVLSKSKGQLDLSGLTELSDAAAKSLAKHQKLLLPSDADYHSGNPKIEKLVQKYR